MKKRAFDAIAELDALAARWGAQGWRLTRLHNDNAGESFLLEISRTAGEYTKWEHAAYQHAFTRGRWDDESRISLARLIQTENEGIDEEIALARMRVEVRDGE